MSEKDYMNFLKLHDAIRINNYVIYSHISKIGHICYGAYNVIEMDGQYYINEQPSFSDRTENARQKCIDFAIIKN